MMKMTRTLPLIALTALTLLTACTDQNTAAIRQTPTITFANFGAVTLPVNRVDVIPPTDRPGNTTGYGVLPMPLDEVGRRYAEKRFAAGGGVSNMNIVIADTRFAATDLKPGTKTGLDILTMQRRQQISIGMTIRIEIADGARRVVKDEHRLDRKTEIPENLSLAERDMRLLNFTERFMADLDKQVMAGLREEFPTLAPTASPDVPVMPPLAQPPASATDAKPADSAY